VILRQIVEAVIPVASRALQSGDEDDRIPAIAAPLRIQAVAEMRAPLLFAAHVPPRKNLHT
jgi:hypothetical protein